MEQNKLGMHNLGMCLLNIYIDVPLLYSYTMKNIHFTRTVTTEQKCKSKTIIEVNSTLYNSDRSYQKSIDEMLKKAR